ncbi:MAG: VCBS repeat-containing protein [Flammeovirgaceae bacterium]|nr:VCBS repeat-containing protein [Flammeovirgaceae bacterium]
MKRCLLPKLSLLLIILLAHFALKAQPTVLTSDSLALVDLYNSTNGASWTDKTNWLSTPVNTWFGITVTANRVTAITLSGNNVTGPLPTSIGNLSALVFLQLDSNQLTGSIPSSIGNLLALQYLILSSNQLTGSIPASMGNLSTLLMLNLGFNQLSGSIPSSIGNLLSLKFLNIFYNQLSGSIPSSIGNMVALENLYLSNNQLSGTIPTSVGNLSALLILNLENNQLSGSIPSSIGNLTALTDLDLSFNLLSGNIPVELGNLVSLQRLLIHSNKLSGSLPSSLTILPLSYLNIENNQLSGTLPAEVSNFTTLQYFLMDNNQFEGALPVLPAALRSLWIKNNKFSSLPVLTNNTWDNLEVRDNYFTFEDLEPNVAIPNISYNSQKTFGGNANAPIAITVGSPINLSFTVGGSANTYQWKLDASNVGVNSNVYSVASATAIDVGTYTLTVTNSLVPGLTLTSLGPLVYIKQEGLFDWVDGGELTNEGFDVTGNSDGPYSGQWGDFNNDGLEDIFMTGASFSKRSYLYKNNGNGTFSKLPNSSYYFTSSRSITWGDYNNDGFLDAFAPDLFSSDSVAFPSIFKNNGNETFARIQLPGIGINAGVWMDADNDGDLDLVYNDATISSTLYRNDGNDTFAPITGVFTTYTSWNPVAVDINNDSRMDLFFLTALPNRAV